MITELTQDGETRLLEGTDEILCTHSRSQEKETVSPQQNESDLPVSVQESLVEAWVGGGLLQSQKH